MYEYLYAKTTTTTTTTTKNLEKLEEIDEFLETYNLTRLSQEEIETLNRPITSLKLEIKSLPTRKSPGSDRFTAEFYQVCKKELLRPIFLLNIEAKNH